MFFLQAEDGIRDLVRSRGLGDVYKRQNSERSAVTAFMSVTHGAARYPGPKSRMAAEQAMPCLLYTSDAADERSSVDLGGRRIIKKNTKKVLL